MPSNPTEKNMDLNELAARVERLSGPDRHIGAQVEIAMRGFPERAYAQRNAMRARGTPEINRDKWAAEYFGAGSTASLDAAMTLAPADLPGLTLNLSADAAQALIFRDGDGVVGRGDATGGEPLDRAARAITAAALRSQATSQ